MDQFTMVTVTRDGTSQKRHGLTYWEAADHSKLCLASNAYVQVTITRDGWHKDAATGKLSTADDPVIVANSLD